MLRTLICGWVLFGCVVTVVAQPATKKPAEAAKAEDPFFEELKFENKDNIELYMNYYKFKPAENETDKKRLDPKSAPVVLILHHDKGNKQDYDALARELQNSGNIVFVPDLRGYGKSNKQLIKTVTGGQIKVTNTKTITVGRLADYEEIIVTDLELVKTQMVKLHDKGELNIRKLCVVGVEMGAILALNWSLLKDWEWPDLTTGPQAKDVRGLILISPRWNFKGMVINHALEKGDYIQFIPAMFMTGSKDSTLASDQKRLADQYERYFPKDDKAEKKVFAINLETTLQGYKLLSERKLTVTDDMGRKLVADPVSSIKGFLEARVRTNEFEWKARSKTE
jgi:alpha-beta hydrolase superfamily lysophospholipase